MRVPISEKAFSWIERKRRSSTSDLVFVLHSGKHRRRTQNAMSARGNRTIGRIAPPSATLPMWCRTSETNALPTGRRTHSLCLQRTTSTQSINEHSKKLNAYKANLAYSYPYHTYPYEYIDTRTRYKYYIDMFRRHEMAIK